MTMSSAYLTSFEFLSLPSRLLKKMMKSNSPQIELRGTSEKIGFIVEYVLPILTS